MRASCLAYASLVMFWTTALCGAAPAAEVEAIRSARSGPWSAAQTWQDGRVPGTGERVLVRAGHRVVYDVKSEQAIRSIRIAGQLTFARDRDTRLDVGLILVQAGEETTAESGFDCLAHGDHSSPAAVEYANAEQVEKPALEVGTADAPIPTGHTALIRLTYFEGQDKESFPAIVCCGGRMEFHGAEMSRTWLRLGAPAKKGDAAVTLEEAMEGWRKGDRIILTATTRQNKREKTFKPSTRDDSQTEERTIVSVDGEKLTLDRPLAFTHTAEGEYRGDVANLSRNVVVESADPSKARGHTMYHRNSAGSISYAEFRHLGKDGVLGRYSLHFHLAGDTMRGSSIVGASIWDSGNRWITVHGTNYLVIRDCVGYQSMGHGFFLENGTEVYNVLDRNLAVQAYSAKKLPNQALPFDVNDGAGFWWANSMNAFTRNVAAECDEYGYFFQAIETPDFKPAFDIRQPDGSKKKIDVRTLPFMRFEDNESNCQRRHGFNLGGSVPFGKGVDGVGPDTSHPFVVKDFRVWNSHWSIHPVSPSLLIDGLDVHACEYGPWRAVYKDHAYRNVRLDQIAVNAEFMPIGTRPVEAQYPKPLKPVDDLPPVTMITRVSAADAGRVVVRGVAADNGEVRSVSVNGHRARSVAGDYREWEVTLDDLKTGRAVLTAMAEDLAGNIEKTPHVMTIDVAPRNGVQ